MPEFIRFAYMPDLFWILGTVVLITAMFSFTMYFMHMPLHGLVGLNALCLSMFEIGYSSGKTAHLLGSRHPRWKQNKCSLQYYTRKYGQTQYLYNFDCCQI